MANRMVTWSMMSCDPKRSRSGLGTPICLEPLSQKSCRYILGYNGNQDMTPGVSNGYNTARWHHVTLNQGRDPDIFLFSLFHHCVRMTRLRPDVFTRFLSCTIVFACWNCIILVSMSSYTLSIHFLVVFFVQLFHWQNNAIFSLATVHFPSLKHVQTKSIFVNQSSARRYLENRYNRLQNSTNNRKWHTTNPRIEWSRDWNSRWRPGAGLYSLCAFSSSYCLSYIVFKALLFSYNSALGKWVLSADKGKGQLQAPMVKTRVHRSEHVACTRWSLNWLISSPALIILLLRQ